MRPPCVPLQHVGTLACCTMRSNTLEHAAPPMRCPQVTYPRLMRQDVKAGKALPFLYGGIDRPSCSNCRCGAVPAHTPRTPEQRHPACCKQAATPPHHHPHTLTYQRKHPTYPSLQTPGLRQGRILHIQHHIPPGVLAHHPEQHAGLCRCAAPRRVTGPAGAHALRLLPVYTRAHALAARVRCARVCITRHAAWI